MKYKTNYRKTYSSKDGTVYRQTIYISKEEHKQVLKALESEKNERKTNINIYSRYEYMKDNLTTFVGVKNNVLETSLTPASFIAKVLNIDNFKTDRNVRFIIY